MQPGVRRWNLLLMPAGRTTLSAHSHMCHAIYIHIYSMILQYVRAIVVWPVWFCMFFYVLDVIVRQRGHNLRDLPSILTPGRSCRHILRTKWDVTTTQQQLWLSFNLVLSLSSISLLLGNLLSHASVLIFVRPRPFHNGDIAQVIVIGSCEHKMIWMTRTCGHNSRTTARWFSAIVIEFSCDSSTEPRSSSWWPHNSGWPWSYYDEPGLPRILLRGTACGGSLMSPWHKLHPSHCLL